MNPLAILILDWRSFDLNRDTQEHSEALPDGHWRDPFDEQQKAKRGDYDESFLSGPESMIDTTSTLRDLKR